ncbi:spore gernimation protein [Paenibacillus sp. 19GGS1-52]|uniref:spore germination protein GerPB n=1 Tax=Paenibacillus sp. 19GGS1-52 TaxID=2758563 RepID=UPI001EFBEF99|nr:spore germination protein GerPB [Paenibacillus sp. 19GGS1-52]ULO10081.1 spore gernimation protein [Paenibacillus sp. 19GGS1-52]
MNLSVYQCISIHSLSIGTLSSSSILQIGTSGKINALSHNYQNTGGETSSPPDTTGDSPRVLLPAPAEMYPR